MAAAPKELSELIKQRDRLFGLLQERRALGAFDANAQIIISLLESVLAILSYQIKLSSKPESRSKA